MGARLGGDLHGERLMAFRVFEPVVERIVAKLEENHGHLGGGLKAWGGGGGPLEKDHLTGIFSFKEEVWDRDESEDRSHSHLSCHVFHGPSWIWMARG